MSIGAWLAVIALMVIVTSIRAYSASKKASQTKVMQDRRADSNQYQLDQLILEAGMRDPVRYISPEASMALDTGLGVLAAVSGGRRLKWNTADLKSVQVIDHSEDYRLCQDLEAYHSGVKRDSLYNPFGKYKTREVRDGHRRFETYRGSVVYGLRLTDRTGSETTVACFNGDGTVNWSVVDQWPQEQNHLEFLRFAETLQRAVGR